jgi:SHS2 domain-containing protein
MPYHFLPEVATADIAFEASGRDLQELFKSAAEATLNAMIDNPDAIEPREQRRFTLENEALDLLLFNYLGEFIYYKDAEQLLLRPGTAQIEKRGTAYLLTGEAQGEKLDPERHLQRVDVKAVTLHHFKVEPTPDGWSAFVILDI